MFFEYYYAMKVRPIVKEGEKPTTEALWHPIVLDAEIKSFPILGIVMNGVCQQLGVFAVILEDYKLLGKKFVPITGPKRWFGGLRQRIVNWMTPKPETPAQSAPAAEEVAANDPKVTKMNRVQRRKAAKQATTVDAPAAPAPDAVS